MDGAEKRSRAAVNEQDVFMIKPMTLLNLINDIIHKKLFGTHAGNVFVIGPHCQFTAVELQTISSEDHFQFFQ